MNKEKFIEYIKNEIKNDNMSEEVGLNIITDEGLESLDTFLDIYAYFTEDQVETISRFYNSTIK